MKYGDKHIIVSAISDKIELHIEPLRGGDLLLISTIDTQQATPVVADAFLNRDHARVLFGILGAYLHSWENPTGD